MPKQLPGKQEKWLYTVTQVEEVKRMLGFVPIMIATIIFNTGASCCQLTTIAIQVTDLLSGTVVHAVLLLQRPAYC